MRVFLAGSTGAIGRVLLPRLISERHEVTALVRDRRKAPALEAMGATVAVADALDANELSAAIGRARPEVIIHQLTALTGAGNLEKLDEEMAVTNRLRIEVTDTMLAAARAAGTRRFIAQSFCGWTYAREGGPIKSEEDRLDPDPPVAFSKTLAAIRYVEEAMRQGADVGGVALRYGFFYGPGTSIAADGEIMKLVQLRKMPIVGGGAGIWSFIHVEDAVRATIAAMSLGAPGIYNVADDDPAPVSSWLPFLAGAVGAKPPRKVPAWIARFAIGDGGVSMMTRNRGVSNARAKRDLAWQPKYSTWRLGFVSGLA